MTDQFEDAVPADEEVAEEESEGVTGVGWLYTVAALSVINTLIVVFGGEFSLIFGATSALIAAYMFSPVVSVLITLVIAAAFAGLGFLASKRAMWALAVATVLYLADVAAGLYAVFVVGDDSMLLDLGAHAIVLWFLGKGFLQLRAEMLDRPVFES